MSFRQASRRRQLLSVYLGVLHKRIGFLHEDILWNVWRYLRSPIPASIALRSTVGRQTYIDNITTLGDSSFLTLMCLARQSLICAYVPSNFGEPVAELFIGQRFSIIGTEGTMIFGVDSMNLTIVRLSLTNAASVLPDIPLPLSRAYEVVDNMVVSNHHIFITTLGDLVVYYLDLRSDDYNAWVRIYESSDEIDSFDCIADTSLSANHQLLFIVDNTIRYRIVNSSDEDVSSTSIQGAHLCRFIPNTSALACIAVRTLNDVPGNTPIFQAWVVVVDLLTSTQILKSDMFSGSGLLKCLSVTNDWDIAVLASLARSEYLSITALTLEDQNGAPT
ncbi:hypothetical protein FOL47_000749 [Perkinsus chesapeaki]|uniref:Uncharacterized protein n=1 Tax=Perkinsus chesapeaki TaxID=330153 RepID=A0A7J6MKZ8_PERCH|nr:hypothetical protein FOL47_000749 [Perkinsus chesapeaki]